MSSAGVGPDGKVYCKHMEEAAKRKSNTSKHPSREFYCCKRRQSDATKCDFWYWADQLPRPMHSFVQASSSSAAQTPTRASKEGVTTGRTRLTATPPTRPPQKHFPPFSNPSETPRSRKRLECIEAGLRQREQDLSPRHPSLFKESEPSTSLSDVQSIPRPSSPVPTEVDCEVETQPRKTTSFLGLDYSPEPTATTIIEEGLPSTPKKPRLTPPGIPVVDPPVSSGNGLPPTPPQSTRRAAQSDELELELVPATTRSRKGKERECVPPVRNRDQDGCSGESQDSLPLFTLLEDTSSTSSASPTTAESVLDYTDGMKARVKALSEYMESFDIDQAATLLQRIERQKIQYECRDRSQKMRIEQLIVERDKLAAQVSSLKEALQRSEESSRVKDGEI